jgi:hypothetical protein
MLVFLVTDRDDLVRYMKFKLNMNKTTNISLRCKIQVEKKFISGINEPLNAINPTQSQTQNEYVQENNEAVKLSPDRK